VGPEYGDGDLLVARLISGFSPESARSSSDDAGLVEAACRGDQAAFGLLYERYAGLVHGLLLAKVPRVEADDLVQEVFLTAMRRLLALRDRNKFGAWLSAIARNLANDHYRRRRPGDPLIEDPPDAVGICRGAHHAGNARQRISPACAEGHGGSGERCAARPEPGLTLPRGDHLRYADGSIHGEDGSLMHSSLTEGKMISRSGNPLRGVIYFAASFSGVAVKSPVTPKGWTSTLPVILPESSTVAV